MKFLLVTPPLTQLNTPYPATAVLKGYLQGQGHEVAQADLGIELVDRVFSSGWLLRYASGSDAAFMRQAAGVVEQVKRFLRGEDRTLALRIVNGSLLPEGPRHRDREDVDWAFGAAGIDDRARYLATLFLEDVADCVRRRVDGHFELIRYAEQLAAYAPAFNDLDAALTAPPSVVDELMIELLSAHVERVRPGVVSLTVPFPGCLYGALRCGRWLKQHYPRVTVHLGGGFVNTEWRQLADERVFDCCDFISYDDGELPLLRLADLLEGRCGPDALVRTRWRGGRSDPARDGEQVDFASLPVQDFSGLPLDKYLSTADMTNPMHRLWSDGRWNKMMMAHGCYWHRCAFCDTGLDYIGRFAAPSATTVVNRMEHIVAQTGSRGFHFVDEALPPRLLAEVCREILRRGLVVSFWGNIRFEKAYTVELCHLMAAAGCVAVSGGLEVASDRLLRLMDKGVTIEQTVQACRHFRDAGIMVHTYLMYGFPTETLGETLDALDTVRRMFGEGIVQSAFWHRYAMTCHSPSGLHPERYGARRVDAGPNLFCNNEVDWVPAAGGSQFDYDIEEVGRGLRVATYNYMNGLGLDQPVRSWFPGIRFHKPKKKSRP